MLEQPRLALGTVQAGCTLDLLVRGIVEVFRRYDWDCQVFSSQAKLEEVDRWGRTSRAIQRHLDSWLMSPAEVSWYFARGSEDHDLSLVCGCYEEASRAKDASACAGGSLDALCERLALPRIVVLDVRLWDPCCPPRLPAEAAGILLMGCRDDAHLAQCQTVCETLWSVPVLGGLFGTSVGEALGCEWRGPAWAPRDACRRLGDELQQTVHLGRLLNLALAAKKLPEPSDGPNDPEERRPIDVALACDEAFHCYFPDTLECLERAGARLLDFSPLRGESIPESAELLWIGCGHPERYAERLSRNVCMHEALRAHVRAGRRVYAEGAGLAYICQSMECHGRRFRMAGLLPARAKMQSHGTRPVELALQGESWPSDQPWRGYLNSDWALEADGPLIDYSARSSCPLSLVGHARTVGSRIPLHCASHSKLLSRLVWPVTGAAG